MIAGVEARDAWNDQLVELTKGMGRKNSVGAGMDDRNLFGSCAGGV